MAWREAPFYTERERAALAWTEAVTLASVDHVPDEVYVAVRKQFTDEELVAPFAGHYCHQQLEPAGDQFPQRARLAASCSAARARSGRQTEEIQEERRCHDDQSITRTGGPGAKYLAR